MAEQERVVLRRIYDTTLELFKHRDIYDKAQSGTSAKRDALQGIAQQSRLLRTLMDARNAYKVQGEVLILPPNMPAFNTVLFGDFVDLDKMFGPKGEKTDQIEDENFKLKMQVEELKAKLAEASKITETPPEKKVAKKPAAKKKAAKKK